MRRRVVDAWVASPARFREDANAEDDLVRGGYRDRVVVELAQNAADAASRAGVTGRLLLRLAGDVLIAANTGAPLDAAAVESLATLRASTKRDAGSVGRFGVGFAAVLAVTDEPRITSRTGGARWDVAAARELLADVPQLQSELARRDGQLPVLRLPFPWSAQVPDGYETIVELPLRDASARELVTRLLADVDDALLLALPALAEVVVDVGGERRTLVDDGTWRVVRRHGTLPAYLLADRPVEERDRPTWALTWARPLAGQPVPRVLHAPTPTDEPVDLPALLVASFPLDPTRRHVAPGALTDAIVTEAARAYVDLVLECEASERRSLVPGAVPVGRLDADLRRAMLTELARAPWLRTVAGQPVAPRDAVSVVRAAQPLLAVCAEVVEGLVSDDPVLARLGTRRLELADLVDLLGELDRPPGWWREVYAALEAGSLDSRLLDWEALGALPVPLADGRLVRGPRGVVVLASDLAGPQLAGPDLARPNLAGPDLAPLGVRVVHPEAAHPVLLRLGAERASPRGLLDRAESRAAVEDAWDGPDPLVVTETVLGLVAAAGLRPGELTWLGGLPLLDASGEVAAAEELVVADSVVARLVESGASGPGQVHPGLVDRWGASVLAAAGVLADLTVGEVRDLVLDPAAVSHDVLPDLDAWVAQVAAVGEGLATAEVVRGVRELDVVADDAWLALLEAVATTPPLRAALVEPVTVDVAGGGRWSVEPYTAWWVRTRGLIEGRPPAEWAVPGSELAALFDPLPPVEVAVDVLAAVGVQTTLSALLARPDGADALLQRLADPARSVPSALLDAAYRALATDALAAEARATEALATAARSAFATPPDAVRVGSGLVVPAGDAVVVDHPAHLQLAWDPPPIVVALELAGPLADLLDVATTSERVGEVTGGQRRRVPAVVAELLPDTPESWWEHEDLRVGADEVSWWVDAQDRVHASTLEGLAWGLAWVAGRWPDRWAVAAVLADPGRLGDVRAESRLDP